MLSISPFAEEVKAGCTFYKYCVPTARSYLAIRSSDYFLGEAGGPGFALNLRIPDTQLYT
jgi:hypothetical protein